MNVHAICTVIILTGVWGCSASPTASPHHPAGTSSTASPAVVSVPAVPPPAPVASPRMDRKAGAMPADASWTGVYYSPLFGYLHLVERGNHAEGKWMRPDGTRWGEIEGVVDGNLLRFEWAEHSEGLVGPSARREGRGYFVYERPEGTDVDDVVSGEVGEGDDDRGTTWDAVKQRNLKPDLGNIGAGARAGGGDWDAD